MINKKPSSILSIDKYTNQIESPTLLLETRSGKVIGKLKYANWNISLVANGIDEISFEVHRPADITSDMDKKTKRVLKEEHKIWDKLVDLKIVEIKDFARYEISVSYTDNTETIKAVTGQSLEVELGQIPLRELHINDDEATSVMELTEYNKYHFTLPTEDDPARFIPTTFYREVELGDDEETAMRKVKNSLLNRVLEKAPHWKIGHVPEYVAISEKDNPEHVSEHQREYTVDGETIYDFLTGTIAKESNVVFIFDTINRIINCYSLCDCIDQETRVIVEHAYGEDTMVFVSKDKLATEISITSEKDNVKNCFKVESGDEIIDSMVAVANMSGDNYIYSFSNLQYDDMSEELSAAIKAYTDTIKDPKITGEYEELFLNLCKEYNYKAYFESGMMPGVSIVKETGVAESNNIDVAAIEEVYSQFIKDMNKDDFMIAVSDLDLYNEVAHVGVDNRVDEMTQVYVDTRFKVEVDKTYGYPKYEIVSKDENGKITEGKWTGRFKLIRVSNESEVYPINWSNDDVVTITITDDDIKYHKQLLQKSLASNDMANIEFDFEGSEFLEADGKTINKTKIKEYFQYKEDKNKNGEEIIKDGYSLNRLDSFYKSYSGCLGVLNELGNKEEGSDEYYFYKKYVDIIAAIGEGWEDEEGNKIKSALQERQEEVDNIKARINNLEENKKDYASKYAFEIFINNYEQEHYPDQNLNLYNEFCMYHREDTYTNSNYISDGKTDGQCLEIAKNLLDVAYEELEKACVLQRTVSTTLNNLFMIPEFEPLYDSFALYNYIRVATKDEILKLRLIGIDYSGESTSDITVTFSDEIESVDGTTSDLQSILEQAASIATSFPATVLQAKQGASAKINLDDIYNTGLNMANVALKNSDDEEVVIDNYGILCREKADDGSYSDEQLRVIRNMIAMTDDGWKTTKSVFGKIQVGEDGNGNPIMKYGLITEALIGKLIVGENVIVSGVIKSDDYSIDENGNVKGSIIDFSNGTINYGSGALVLNKDENNNYTLTVNGTICADDGYFKGKLEGATGDFTGKVTADELIANTKGTIAGWHFNSSSMWNTNSSNNYVTLSNGTNANQDVLVVKKSDGSYPFYLRADGTLSATKADISGNITATTLTATTSGTIACWGFNNNCIYKGNATHGNASGMYFGNDGLSITDSFKVNSDGTIYAKRLLLQGGVMDIGTTSIRGGVIGNPTTSNTNPYIVNVAESQAKTGDAPGEINMDAGSGYHVTYFGWPISTASETKYRFTGVRGCNVKVYAVKANYNGSPRGGNLHIHGEGAVRISTGNNETGEEGTIIIKGQKYETTSAASESDNRVKNIYNLETNYDDFYMNLKSISYTFIDGGKRKHLGYDAQQVEQALLNSSLTTNDFAGLVKMQGKYDYISPNGNTIYFDDFYTLRYPEFIALNTHMTQKALIQNKEQDEKIRNLENEIENLKQIIERAGLM